MEIFTNQTLQMNNVLSYRGQVTQQELVEKVKEMNTYIKSSGAQLVGPTVSTTFSIQPGSMPPIMDTEILIPLDKEIKPDPEFTLKKRFNLSNALKVECKGNPLAIQGAVMELNQYITSHNMVPVTSLYNVTVKEAKDSTDYDSVEVHLYIGVSENTNAL